MTDLWLWVFGVAFVLFLLSPWPSPFETEQMEDGRWRCRVRGTAFSTTADTEGAAINRAGWWIAEHMG